MGLVWYLYLSEPPVSHLLIALSEIRSFWAKSFCVYPFSFRSSDIKAPNFFLSSSYIFFYLSFSGFDAFILQDKVQIGNRIKIELNAQNRNRYRISGEIPKSFPKGKEEPQLCHRKQLRFFFVYYDFTNTVQNEKTFIVLF